MAPQKAKRKAETLPRGPLAGGLIYDSFASYGWLFVGAWGIGIGAFLIALTFRPFPKEQPAGATA